MCPYLYEDGSIRNSKARRQLRKVTEKQLKYIQKRLGIGK